MLLGGKLNSYRTMYEKFIEVAKKKLFFRPMTVGDEDILLSGNLDFSGEISTFYPVQQHLTCFTGGMLAIAGRIFNRPQDIEVGARLTDGCVWAYKNTPTGIMPETFTAVDCGNNTACTWDTAKWRKASNPFAADEASLTLQIEAQKLSPGFAQVGDARYLLRPEAIESVFIMYRITGESYWLESGWTMFKSIMAHTTTKLAHSAIKNVLSPAPEQVDEMESFWLAETLKYFYMLFSTPDVVNLDEYVLNTEAHPLRRPR
jgi:mannosyl-oligosaccharide alpha-1,2-mannosidase